MEVTDKEATALVVAAVENGSFRTFADAEKHLTHYLGKRRSLHVLTLCLNTGIDNGQRIPARLKLGERGALLLK